MSTKGLMGIDALRDSLHEHAKDAKEKAEATMTEVIEVERQKAADQEAVAIMGRRLEQEANDKLAELDEVAGQRAFIAFGTRPGENPAPAAEQEPQAPAPSEPDASSAGSDNDNGGNTSVQPSVQGPDNSALPWEQQSGQPEPEPEAPNRNPLSPLNWSWMARGAALIGLLIGLLIALVIGSPDAKENAVQWLVNVLWYVGLPGIGFFGFGLAAFLFEERRQDQHEEA